MVTFTVAGLLTLVIFLHSRGGRVISDKRKTWFIVVDIGLSLALGMTISHASKAMVVDFRWLTLSRHRGPFSEVSKLHLFFQHLKQKLKYGIGRQNTTSGKFDSGSGAPSFSAACKEYPA
jgi:hypothetical protein